MRTTKQTELIVTLEVWHSPDDGGWYGAAVPFERRDGGSLICAGDQRTTDIVPSRGEAVEATRVMAAQSFDGAARRMWLTAD